MSKHLLCASGLLTSAYSLLTFVPGSLSPAYLRTPRLCAWVPGPGRAEHRRTVYLECSLLTHSLPYLLASLPRREYREYKAKEKEGTLSAEGQDLVGAFRKATEEDRAE